MHRLVSIIIKEFRHLSRDPLALSMIILFPLMMLLIHGFAITLDIDHIPYGIQDEDRTAASRELLDRWDASTYFERVFWARNERDFDVVLDRDLIRIGVKIPKGFEEALQTGKHANVQLLVDGADNNTATIAIGYAQGILQRFYQDRVLLTAQNLRIATELRPQVWFNPTLRSTLFIIPGLLGLVLMMTTVAMTSLAIVREKEHGTVEGILASPIRPIEMILGKLIPYLLIAYVQFIFGILVARFVFEIPMVGGFGILFATTGLFLVVGLSLGLFISTLTDSQQVAWQISFIITMLPSFLLSGFIFPIESMPKFLQKITGFFPIRYYIHLIKAILLKGIGWRDAWSQMWPLFIFLIVFVGISVRRFQKRIA
jgi:ABC-2 type transport system permease protein